ncbi:nuclear transport factor 2 family protein [Kribbella sp. CA-247076]|uniref:nuclear transport factor 2 family protein n=1 Tax=Kribbella sp. CA-247076 TaxID=3239941 RepID=UPI003D8FB975
MKATPEPTGSPLRNGSSPLSGDDVMAVLNRFYAAEAKYVAARGIGTDFTEVAAFLDPEVVVYQAPGLPFTGTGIWRGHRGVQAFLDLFSETWQSMDVIDARALVDGRTVVVLLRVRFCARATGRTVETHIAQVNVVTDGRITKFRPYYWDPAAIADVCS